jgi:hypothetical protein
VSRPLPGRPGVLRAGLRLALHVLAGHAAVYTDHWHVVTGPAGRTVGESPWPAALA